MVWGTLSGLLTPLAVGSGHEQALAPLLVLLLVGAVGGAIANVLVLLYLAFEAVENRPDRLLARGMAGGDVEELLVGSRAGSEVEELLGGLRALTSHLMN